MEGPHTVDGMTPEELTEVQRIHDVVSKAMDQELRQLAQFMVTRRDDQLLGEAEFTLRAKVLRMGAQALAATVNDRKKRGIRVAVSSVPTAAKTHPHMPTEAWSWQATCRNTTAQHELATDTMRRLLLAGLWGVNLRTRKGRQGRVRTGAAPRST